MVSYSLSHCGALYPHSFLSYDPIYAVYMHFVVAKIALFYTLESPHTLEALVQA